LEKRPFVYFYANNYLGHWPNALLALVLFVLCVPFVLLMPLAVIGFLWPGIEGERWKQGAVLLLALILYFTVVHALTLAEERYHIPLLPFLAVFAAWGATRILPSGTPSAVDTDARIVRARRTLLAAALIGLLVLNWGWELQRDAPRLAALFGPQGNMLGIDY
jgi:hypothetical protein